ncbi:hypothetical protein KJ840_02580 [Patescibacteria group bacterium]|nr:hypothetical protein [Patescibacteria group bacterium]
MKNFNQRNRNDRGGFSGRDSGQRSMHRATCDECGQSCEVPFRPSGGKPIYCSNCFGKNKSSDYGRSGGRDSGKGSYGNNQMFAAVCDKCGKNCEVPFKPSGGKPIFCNECFSQNRGAGSKNILPAKEQFEIINSKLDKILMALNLVVKEADGAKSKKDALALVQKKAGPKKAAKKKSAVSASARPKKKKSAKGGVNK